MTSHARHTDRQIKALQHVLEALGTRIEATEDGREWRRLAGSNDAPGEETCPLARPERDNLRDRLAATNPDWRAYRLVEQAIAELAGAAAVGDAPLEVAPEVNGGEAAERIRIKVPAGRLAVAADEAGLALPAASSPPVTSVLDRIRPVSEILGRPSTATSAWLTDTARTAPWGDTSIPRSPARTRNPAVPPVVAAAPPPVSRAKPAPAAPTPEASQRASDAPPSAASRLEARADDTRLADVEAELDRLIETDVAIWSLPETRRAVAAEHAVEAPSPGDGGSAAGDLDDIPGAEVVIVKAAEKAGMPPSGAANPAGNVRPPDPEEHAAYHLDIEEASVEIVVTPARRNPAST